MVRHAAHFALILATTLCLAAGHVRAQEFVIAKGKLSDDDFYRLVACAAPAAGECQKPFVRWAPSDARDLTVSLVQVDPDYPERISARVTELLDETLSELNESGANLRLRRVAPDVTPDISLHLLDLPQNSKVSGTGLPWFDGNPLSVARMQLGWRNDGTIFICAVAFSRDVAPKAVRRVLLEEITQCLGLMTDVRGGYYESRSIFSEDGVQSSTLKGQDLMALRRHYP
jgi:Protein of unknown function (DUF2927)